MRVYNKGQLVDIYYDYQNNERYLGKAELVRFISKGLPFMLEDYTHAPIYNTEKWKVEWLEKADETYPYETTEYNIRHIEEYLEKEDPDYEEIDLSTVLVDRFLTIDGEEIY